MARKQTAPVAAEQPAPPPPVDPTKFQRPAAEVEESVRALAARFGVNADLPAKARWKALSAAIARAPKPHPKEWAWDTLRAHLRREATDIAAVNAAEALGLGIREALDKAAAGWTTAGSPKRERVPGEDDE